MDSLAACLTKPFTSDEERARSLYRWQGAVADEREVVTILKTRRQDWPALLSRLHELHPFEIPECVAVRIAAGAPKYLAWLEDALTPPLEDV